jgi:hypothetical protein
LIIIHIEHTVEALARIPTWPRRAETVQLVLTAVLLPVVLWLIQRILDSLISF